MLPIHTIFFQILRYCCELTQMENKLETVSLLDLPETVIELVLAKVPEEDILTCNLVCRAWKELICRKSFWKKRFQDKKLNLYEIPKCVQDMQGGWMILYSQYCRGILSKNYNRMPPCQKKFPNQQIPEAPSSCHILLADQELERNGIFTHSNFFEREIDMCYFATSFRWCSKSYKVDLWREGLKPGLMKLILPFRIKCTRICAAGFDCGSRFEWEIRILDSQLKFINVSKHPNILVEPRDDWESAEYSIEFRRKDANHLKDLRYVEFLHRG
ncbi:unnamed protein product [Orchesella dallaii]